MKDDLFLRFGLAETLDAIAFLPLPALPEELDALVALKDVALYLETAGGFEARMLGHGKLSEIELVRDAKR